MTSEKIDDSLLALDILSNVASEDGWKPTWYTVERLAEEDELVGNDDALELIQQLVKFHNLCYTMLEMGLTFDPMPYAGQCTETKPVLEFYEHILKTNKRS